MAPVLPLSLACAGTSGNSDDEDGTGSLGGGTTGEEDIEASSCVEQYSEQRSEPSEERAIIYVVDSSDTEKLVIAKEEFHAILEEEELKGVDVLIFANTSEEAATTVCEYLRPA
nr:ADP-ribosylation factor 1 [Ipomoea batatas]